MTKYEKVEINEIEKEVKSYQTLSEHFIKNYNLGLKSHNK